MRCQASVMIVALGLATTISAQTPPPRTNCRNVGTVVTCTNLAPVSESVARKILTSSVPPAVPVPQSQPPRFVAPLGWTDIGPIRGKVFSDSWPFESAGIYECLWRPCVAAPYPPYPYYPANPFGFYADIRLPYDPLTHRWYR